MLPMYEWLFGYRKRQQKKNIDQMFAFGSIVDCGERKKKARSPVQILHMYDMEKMHFYSTHMKNIKMSKKRIKKSNSSTQPE